MAIPDLIARIDDESEGVRISSLQALTAMGREAKEAIPPASNLFDRPTSEAVLVAAAQLLGVNGPDGIARLEKLCQKALPSTVREEMCKSLSRAESIKSATRAWMIEQAELLAVCRESVTAALVKGVTKDDVQELLRSTLPFKPRKPGEKEVKYEVDYRVWAIITLRKLDLSGSPLREARQMVIDRLKLLIMSGTDPEVVAEAKAALTEFQK